MEENRAEGESWEEHRILKGTLLLLLLNSRGVAVAWSPHRVRS